MRRSGGRSSSGDPPPKALLLDPSFPELRNLVVETTGLGYYRERETELAWRLAARELASCAVYRAFPEGEGVEGELDALVDELAIVETYFVRDAEQMAALEGVVLPRC